MLVSLGGCSTVGSTAGFASLRARFFFGGRSALGFRSRFSLGGFFGRSAFGLRESDTSFFQNGTFSSDTGSGSGSGTESGSGSRARGGDSSPSVSQE